MQACNKCCVLKYVFNLFCEPISLSLSRFVSQSPSHCRALWAVSKVLVSQALFGSLLLSFWLSNWLNLSLSLSLIQARSLWLTLALSGSPRLTLARSGSLSVFLRRSSAHNILAGLVKSLPQFILIWCQAEGRELVKCYHFASFCDSVPTSNSTGRWSGLANRGEIGERANKQYHLLQYLSEHLLVLLMTISTRAEWKRSKL